MGSQSSQGSKGWSVLDEIIFSSPFSPGTPRLSSMTGSRPILSTVVCHSRLLATCQMTMRTKSPRNASASEKTKRSIACRERAMCNRFRPPRLCYRCLLLSRLGHENASIRKGKRLTVLPQFEVMMTKSRPCCASRECLRHQGPSHLGVSALGATTPALLCKRLLLESVKIAATVSTTAQFDWSSIRPLWYHTPPSLMARNRPFNRRVPALEHFNFAQVTRPTQVLCS